VRGCPDGQTEGGADALFGVDTSTGERKGGGGKLPSTVSLLSYFLSPPCGYIDAILEKGDKLCMRLNISRRVYMMNITAQCKRGDFVPFLSAGFLPDDFKPHRKP
jgi:hypothetical protein